MDVNEAARDKDGLLLKNEDVYSWAANLSREGEKNNPDYLVEWILQPRSKDPHSVMPSIWSAAANFQLSAANVAALEERIKAAFTRGGVADFTKTDFYNRPETSFIPPELKLSGPEVSALRNDLTIAKCVREAKLVVAYLKSLVNPDKDKLNAPQEEIFKRNKGNASDAYAFMESDGEFDESIVRDVALLPNGQKDAESEETEPKTLKLKGYAEFKRLMDESYDARLELDKARAGMSATLGVGGDVSKYADAIVVATKRIRDARTAMEGTFAGFGKKYVSYYGCGSCHSIPGLEDESKVGTELTYEGSKLIERLDFGLHHERPEPEDPKSANQAEFAPLMTHSGGRTLGGNGFELPELFKRDFIKHKHDYDTKLVWFTGKVYSPRQYDKGKRRTNWFERLRMPLFELDDEETRLVGMFIAGSRETKLPQEKFIYQLKGEAKVKADGWWILRRYNCVGCHDIGRHNARIRSTELFGPDGVNGKLNTPPKLNDAGLRINPSWSVAWLQHPHMIRHMQLDGDSTGYDLGLRMPNFGLTESEARSIVAFLASYAKAPQAYSPPPHVTLTQQEQDFAKSVIASENCGQCHDYREDVDGYRVPGGKAPNLGNAQERARYQWVHGWLTNPDLIQPVGRMFRFFRVSADGKSIFNDDPAIGGTPDYSKILNLEGTARWPADQMPKDPAAVLRDYVLFYYPKTRAGQDELQELSRKFTDAKQKIK
jgi:cytochrome c551/c552